MRQIVLIIMMFLIILFQSCGQHETMQEEFERKTGLAITDSFVPSRNNSDSFPHEGEHSIVFQTTEKQISTWLDNKPPWGLSKWKKGSIPYNLGIACQFGFNRRVGVGTDSLGKMHYSGDKDLEMLLNDTTLYFSYRIDCCEDSAEIPVSRGALLIIRPKTRFIYYSNWSY